MAPGKSLQPIAGVGVIQEDSPLIGGELSIPPDDGETENRAERRSRYPQAENDGGGGAVDVAAAICPSLNGKPSVYPLPASMASWPSASTQSPAAPWDRPLAHRAHRPQTNGNACVFIRTMLSGWGYGAI